MNRLSKELLTSGFKFPTDLKVPRLKDLPERVIQFGEGNFLRAFVDWMFHRLNQENMFNGRVVVIQPLPTGLVPQLNEQDGLYTLLLRGIENGKIVEEKEVISSISRGINPYSDWEAFIKCAEDPNIEYVVSNTTEAGIVFEPSDRPDMTPPSSFPAKLAVYLYHRWQHFNGDPGKGMVIIPCELIDRNGDNLKKVILQLAEVWQLPDGFKGWVGEHNYFLNTLVDRVVPGYPRDEIAGLQQYLRYEDRLLDTGEFFHLWVIEGPQELAAKLPFEKVGLNVIWTHDMTPYRTRKVRILNGAHTASVPAAFLYGLDTVGEMMAHPVLGRYVKDIVFNEIIPSINLDRQMLEDFANAVIERFKNPYIKHYLLSILLNSTSKFKTRVLPSLLEYIENQGQIPKLLSFSLAALLAFYKDGEVEGNILHGNRAGHRFTVQDDQQALEIMTGSWSRFDGSRKSLDEVTARILASKDLWGEDLNAVPGLTAQISNHLYSIATRGIQSVVADLVGS